MITREISYNDLRKDLTTEEKLIDDVFAAKVGRPCFDEYIRMLDAMAEHVDVEEELDQVDGVTIEGQFAINYCTAYGVEEIAAFYMDGDEPNVLIPNADPITTEFVATLAEVDIVSTKYDIKRKFYPFTRQHKIVADAGDFILDGEIVSFEFPNVGFEMMTNQYEHSLGIMLQNNIVSSVNNVSHLAYSCRAYNYGVDFMVFSVSTRNGISHFLWDNVQIVPININNCVSGIRTNDKYFVYHKNKAMYLFPDNFQDVPFMYIDDSCFDVLKAGVLVNIDGVELLVPHYKTIVLKNDSRGRMTDYNGNIYQVDHTTRKSGVYRIQDGKYYFEYTTKRRADNATFIGIVRSSVMTMADFQKYFIMPVDGQRVMTQEIFAVQIVKNKQELITAIKQKKLPMMYYAAREESKRGAVMALARMNAMYALGREGNSITDGFFVANNHYHRRKIRSSVMLIQRKIKDKEKFLCLSFYPYDTLEPIGKCFTQRLCIAGTSKVMDVPLRRLMKRRIYNFTSQEKRELILVYKGFKRARESRGYVYQDGKSMSELFMQVNDAMMNGIRMVCDDDNEDS